MEFDRNILRMVMRLIPWIVMVLNVVDAAFCFDDSVGHILVTLQNRSAYNILKWNIRWEGDGNWSPLSWMAKDSAGSVTGSGCSSGGAFGMRARKKRNILLARFDLPTEVHVLCVPGIPYCTFPAVAYSTTVFPKRAYVSGKIRCNCVPGYREIGDATWQNSTGSATYNAQVKALIELEEQIFLSNESLRSMY